jgi:hypothetical protein
MENHRMLGTAEAVVGGTEGGPGQTGVPTTTAAAAGAGGSGPRAGVNGQQRPNPAVSVKNRPEMLALVALAPAVPLLEPATFEPFELVNESVEPPVDFRPRPGPTQFAAWPVCRPRAACGWSLRIVTRPVLPAAFRSVRRPSLLSRRPR